MTIYVALMPVGKFYSIDESSGYWTSFANETDGGLWIKTDGSEHGSWSHDEGSETSGTWKYSNGTDGGQWVSTENEPMNKYAAVNPIGTFYSSDDS
jgi:hypothetical protein